ncbi:tRNA (cytidine/uridine/adenosine-2'-O-)-methyltransferase TrmJ [Candidatus Entotheonellaceae bacterium PAL068K]
MPNTTAWVPLDPDHLTIILVRPQSPGNIGSAARAMRNMGLHRLVLVAPERFPHAAARMMACGAEGLLQQAQIYPTLQDAVAACHWLIGTSARRRRYRKPPLTPRELAYTLPDLCQQHHVGILFGPEDAGLTTPELNLCHEHVVIPTVAAATSLNLAQAVMVLCYEIMQAQDPSPARQRPALATVGEIEAMYDHLRQAFALRGFSDLHGIDRVVDGLRRIFERTQLEGRDVRLIRGMARQLAWALRHPPTSSAD